MTILGGCPISQKIFFLASFSKWIFAEGRSTRSLWCSQTIQGPIRRPKDHLVVKGLSKNVIVKRNPVFGETESWRRGVYFDAEYISATFVFAETIFQILSLFALTDPEGVSSPNISRSRLEPLDDVVDEACPQEAQTLRFEPFAGCAATKAAASKKYNTMTFMVLLAAAAGAARFL